MKNIKQYSESASQLFVKAKQELVDNMAQQGIGVIVWDLATADFHYIPEVVTRTDDGRQAHVVRIMGLYSYDGELYLMEENHAPISINKLYDRDTEVRPTVVTLSQSAAQRALGDPKKAKGYTQQGSLEEWLAIADCYFEALNED